MGTFVETTIVDYCLSSADQGKQTSNFPFPFAVNKWKFAVSLLRLQQTNGSYGFP
jgi:hypothetical protein